MNVRSWHHDSPIGTLAVGVSDHGLRWIDLGGSHPGEAVPRRDRKVATALDSYFAGDMNALERVPIDLVGVTEFTERVLRTLHALPAGQLTSYGALALMAGRPGAARAVGRAVGSNPVPIVVACHRVLAADGTLGGYGGGLWRKRWLLAHEGHGQFDGGWTRTDRGQVAGRRRAAWREAGVSTPA